MGVKLETAAEEEEEAVFADPGTDRRQRKSGAPPTQWSSTPGREVLADEATERSAVKLSPAKESSVQVSMRITYAHNFCERSLLTFISSAAIQRSRALIGS